MLARMTLGRMQAVLQRDLRRPSGRLLTVLLILAVVATGFPRLEAHAHMQGELPHATMVHQGATLDHDHHAGHGHALDEPHDADVTGTGTGTHDTDTDTVQHLHLLPHAVALLASVNAVPVVRAATASMAPRHLVAPATRPEELFRPPIR